MLKRSHITPLISPVNLNACKIKKTDTAMQMKTIPNKS